MNLCLDGLEMRQWTAVFEGGKEDGVLERLSRSFECRSLWQGTRAVARDGGCEEKEVSFNPSAVSRAVLEREGCIRFMWDLIPRDSSLVLVDREPGLRRHGSSTEDRLNRVD